MGGGGEVDPVVCVWMYICPLQKSTRTKESPMRTVDTVYLRNILAAAVKAYLAAEHDLTDHQANLAAIKAMGELDALKLERNR